MKELLIPDRVVRKPNPVIVELLRAGKANLWDGVSGHGEVNICFATHGVRSLVPGGYDHWEELRDAIHEAIALYATYNRWLVSIHPDAIDECRTVIQAARIRWMNQLIEEYGGTP